MTEKMRYDKAEKRSLAKWIVNCDPLCWQKGDPYKRIDELEKLPLKTLKKMKNNIISGKQVR